MGCIICTQRYQKRSILLQKVVCVNSQFEAVVVMVTRKTQGRKTQGTENAGKGKRRKRKTQGTENAGKGKRRERETQGTEKAGNGKRREQKTQGKKMQKTVELTNQKVVMIHEDL